MIWTIIPQTTEPHEMIRSALTLASYYWADRADDNLIDEGHTRELYYGIAKEYRDLINKIRMNDAMFVYEEL